MTHIMRFSQLIVLVVWLISQTGQAQDVNSSPARLPRLKPGEAVATFAGGCFWAQEEGFEQLRGVREVVSGYSGGHVANPTYQQVGTDHTDHAESVQVYYDPKTIRYRDLLDAFLRATIRQRSTGRAPT